MAIDSPATSAKTPSAEQAVTGHNTDPGETPPERRRRQPGLDLLRAVAIVMVVCYHSSGFGFELPYSIHQFGWIGVDLFFVLSGYLIGGQILAQLQERGTFRYGRFYTRRALRILPAYLVVLAAYFLFPAWREYSNISPLWKYLLSVQNIHLQVGTAFTHAWSLAVEDQFYLALPLLLVFVARRPRWAIALPVLIILGGLGLRAWLTRSILDPAGKIPGLEYFYWIYYPTWSRLDPLVLGVVLAAMERHRPVWWQRLTNAGRWLWIPALGALVGGLWFHERDLTVAACVWSFPLIGLGMALLLVCAVSPRLPLNRVAIPGAAYLAGVAYSVYLSHKLVVHAAAKWCRGAGIGLTSGGAILAAYVLILLVGTALYFAVERSFLQLRSRIEA